MAEPSLITNADSLHRLWSHECCRVFQDRLVDDTDRKWFLEVLDKQMHVHFKKKYSEVVNTEPLIYVDFLEGNPNSTRYEEVTELSQAKTILEDMLAKYNSETKNKMDLVVFNYVVEHVSRISRIIKLPYGHALLVGVGGSGRQSATRLAAYVADFKVFQVQLTKTYGREAWRDDMRALLKSAGLQGSPMVFLFTDGQCKEEAFIEDITSILNTGEIPNLFATDELDNIAEGLKSVAKEVCVRACVCPCVFARARVCVCVRACVRACVRVRACASPCVCVCVGTCSCFRTRVSVCLCVCVCLLWFGSHHCVYVYVCACGLTYTLVCLHHRGKAPSHLVVACF